MIKTMTRARSPTWLTSAGRVAEEPSAVGRLRCREWKPRVQDTQNTIYKCCRCLYLSSDTQRDARTVHWSANLSSKLVGAGHPDAFRCRGGVDIHVGRVARRSARRPDGVLDREEHAVREQQGRLADGLARVHSPRAAIVMLSGLARRERDKSRKFHFRP